MFNRAIKKSLAMFLLEGLNQTKFLLLWLLYADSHLSSRNTTIFGNMATLAKNVEACLCITKIHPTCNAYSNRSNSWNPGWQAAQTRRPSICITCRRCSLIKGEQFLLVANRSATLRRKTWAHNPKWSAPTRRSDPRCRHLHGLPPTYFLAVAFPWRWIHWLVQERCRSQAEWCYIPEKTMQVIIVHINQDEIRVRNTLPCASLHVQREIHEERKDSEDIETNLQKKTVKQAACAVLLIREIRTILLTRCRPEHAILPAPGNEFWIFSTIAVTSIGGFS